MAEDRRLPSWLFGLTPKLLLAIVVAEVVGVGALTYVAISKLKDSLEDEFASKGDAIARSLAAGTTEPLTVLTGNPGQEQVDVAKSTLQGYVEYNRNLSGLCYIFLETPDGAVIAHTFGDTFPKGLEKINPISGEQDVEVEPEVRYPGANCLRSHGGIRAIDVAANVSGGTLGVVHVGMDRVAIDQQVASLGRQMLFFAVLFLVASVVISAAAVLILVTRPIQELSRLTGDIVTRGDLRQEIEIRSRDEVGQLAASFGEMLKKLRTIPTSLSGSAADLERAVDSLARLTKAQTSIVQQQASGISEASATTEEIKQTSAVAASKAETVLQVASKAEEFSGAGQTAVDSSIKGLEDIRMQIDSIVDRITNLAERMLQVGEILDRVKDLADQSNVLALNAAIEASKAGEFGKGFAVVAREIRTLADQSKQSTGRIREILAEIQTAIRSTVNITEAGKSRMEQSMKQIQSSGENLREVTAIVHQSSQAARQIAAAVSQQNAGISQISTAINGMKQAMDETVTGISSTEQAAENLRSISGKVAEVISAFRV